MKEALSPTDKTGRADAHGVEVRGSMVDIESLSLQEMFDEEETEVGTIDEMNMRTAAGGGSRFPGGDLEERWIIYESRYQKVHQYPDLKPALSTTTESGAR